MLWQKTWLILSVTLCPGHRSSSEETAKQALLCFWATKMQNESWYQFLLPLKAVTSSYTSTWHKPLFTPLDTPARAFSSSVETFSAGQFSAAKALKSLGTALLLLRFTSVNPPGCAKNPIRFWATTGRILMAEDIVLPPNKTLWCCVQSWSLKPERGVM